MSDTFSRVEVITGVGRRRPFTTEQKLAVIAETMQPGITCQTAGDHRIELVGRALGLAGIVRLQREVTSIAADPRTSGMKIRPKTTTR